MKNILYFTLLIFLCLLNHGCKTSQSLVDRQKMNAETCLQQIHEDKSQIRSLETNFSAQVKVSGHTQNFKGKVKIIPDSVIWLSTHVMGFEIMRAQLDRDSVRILLPMQKQCDIISLRSINQALNGIEISSWFPVLVGDLWRLKEAFSFSEFREENGIYEWTTKESLLQPYELTFGVNKSQPQPQYVSFKTSGKEILKMDYEKKILKIDVSLWNLGFEVSQIEFRWKDVKLDQTLTFPFDIPEKYTVYRR